MLLQESEYNFSISAAFYKKKVVPFPMGYVQFLEKVLISVVNKLEEQMGHRIDHVA